MTAPLLPDPATGFGERVRQRLRDEQVIWFTTVGGDGTPQPNPVWFLWEDNSVLVYNRSDANLLAIYAAIPRCVCILTVTDAGATSWCWLGAHKCWKVPPPHELPGYLDKYRESMTRVSGSPEAFSEAYPVPVRVDVARVRGF